MIVFISSFITAFLIVCHKKVLLGYYGLMSFSTYVSNCFVCGLIHYFADIVLAWHGTASRFAHSLAHKIHSQIKARYLASWKL